MKSLRSGIMLAIAAVSAFGSAAVSRAPQHRAPVPQHRGRYRPRKYGPGRTPNGQRWRSLKRAVNSGWAPPIPTLEAAMRHKWFQKVAFASAMRCKLGQGSAGDRALVEAIGKVLRRKQAQHQRQNLQGAPA